MESLHLIIALDLFYRSSISQIYDELFADQGQTGYRMIEFVDGKLILPEAVKVIQMAE